MIALGSSGADCDLRSPVGVVEMACDRDVHLVRRLEQRDLAIRLEVARQCIVGVGEHDATRTRCLEQLRVDTLHLSIVLWSDTRDRETLARVACLGEVVSMPRSSKPSAMLLAAESRSLGPMITTSTGSLAAVTGARREGRASHGRSSSGRTNAQVLGYA